MEDIRTLWKVTFDLLYDNNYFPSTGMYPCFDEKEICLCLAWTLLLIGFSTLLILTIQLIISVRRLNGSVNALISIKNSAGVVTGQTISPKNAISEEVQAPEMEETLQEVPLSEESPLVGAQTQKMASPTKNACGKIPSF
ncbi:Orf2 [Torque teno zalophus virus 1]|uniref:Orf2 n=3 Tax=Torque teno zalophus virus 1 TaxID=1218490 RepID=C0JSK7_ZCTTV|nr:Orf2 [Torque teno zalophus virus 1]ACN38866.1 Orf2 [Torque teno zalophus virus 1]